MTPAVRLIAVPTCLVFLLVATTRPSAAPKYSEWGAPSNLGAVVNSIWQDFGPAVSKDGLSLYFTSDRPGGSGFDIWVSHRVTKDASWSPPANVGPIINTDASESVPALTRDDHWLLFNRNPSGFGQIDIWASWREHTDDDFGWTTPINLGAGVNTAFVDGNPSFFENDGGYAPELYFSSNRFGLGQFADIFVSQLQPNGVFGPARLVPELSSPAPENRPSIRFDGLEIFFHSSRPGSAGNDLWVSTRNSVFDAWSAPENMGPPLNTSSADQQPYIDADRETLYFVSDRPGGLGALDLYVTSRTKDKH